MSHQQLIPTQIVIPQAIQILPTAQILALLQPNREKDYHEKENIEDIISKYQTAVADNQTDASINPLVVTYARSQTNPASTVYAYYDMDGNGLTSWCLLLNLEMSLKTI